MSIFSPFLADVDAIPLKRKFLLNKETSRLLPQTPSHTIPWAQIYLVHDYSSHALLLDLKKFMVLPTTLRGGALRTTPSPPLHSSFCQGTS